MQSGTSGRISSNSYTVDNLMCCVNYTITVLLYNECGVGSNSSTCACTSKLISWLTYTYLVLTN